MRPSADSRRAWASLVSVPLVVALAAAAAVASLTAWSLQASAAADLAEAGEIQGREVASDAGGPPSASDNRRIIASLDASIAVRERIDEQLQRIEASVLALSRSQVSAGIVTRRALTETERIAALLGGAGNSARDAVGRLGRLERKLEDSARLARLIADELEELDRRMGPSAGRP